MSRIAEAFLLVVLMLLMTALMLGLACGLMLTFGAESLERASFIAKFFLFPLGGAIFSVIVLSFNLRRDAWRERMTTALPDTVGQIIGLSTGACLGAIASFQGMTLLVPYLLQYLVDVPFEVSKLSSHLNATAFTMMTIVLLEAVSFVAAVAALLLVRPKPEEEAPE